MSLQCTSGRLALLAVSRLLLAPSDGSWLTGRKPHDTLGEPRRDSTFSTTQKEESEWFDRKRNIVYIPRDIWNVHLLFAVFAVVLFAGFCFLILTRATSVSLRVPKAAEAQQEASNSYHGNSDAQTDR